MFWKKDNNLKSPSESTRKYPYRFCNLHISEKYKEILFVPYGKIENGIHAEVDNIIIDTWPCRYEDLQKNIELTLNSYAEKTIWIKGRWPSFDKSKAKSQLSYRSDYVIIRLETDNSKQYGDGEVERIKVTAQPTEIDNTYSLTGTGHLLDTKIAQIVLDIFEACSKIRKN